MINMSNTRGEILGEIKKSGEISIPELTKKLNIVTNAVRGHMVLLEKENLVTYKWVRQKRGRPLKIYKLSEDAEAHFPKKYDSLLNEIIKEISLIEGPERLQQILTSMSKRWANEIKAKLRLSGISFDETLSRYVDYLNDQGYLASLQKNNHGYNILNYNCIYRNAARKNREICSIGPAILRELIDAKVSVITTIFDGSPCCIVDITWH